MRRSGRSEAFLDYSSSSRDCDVNASHRSANGKHEEVFGEEETGMLNPAGQTVQKAIRNKVIRVRKLRGPGKKKESDTSSDVHSASASVLMSRNHRTTTAEKGEPRRLLKLGMEEQGDGWDSSFLRDGARDAQDSNSFLSSAQSEAFDGGACAGFGPLLSEALRQRLCRLQELIDFEHAQVLGMIQACLGEKQVRDCVTAGSMSTAGTLPTVAEDGTTLPTVAEDGTKNDLVEQLCPAAPAECTTQSAAFAFTCCRPKVVLGSCMTAGTIASGCTGSFESFSAPEHSGHISQQALLRSGAPSSFSRSRCPGSLDKGHKSGGAGPVKCQGKSSLSAEVREVQMLPLWGRAVKKRRTVGKVNIQDEEEDEDEEDDTATSWVLDPSSTRCLVWDFFCMVLILYDVVMLPLCLLQPYEKTQFAASWCIFKALFWTADRGLTFCTGIRRSHGDVELHWATIAKAQSGSITFWLGTGIVVSEWIVAVGAVKISDRRLEIDEYLLSRFVLLLPLGRMQRCFWNAGFLFSALFKRSEVSSLVSQLFSSSICMAMLSHLVACVWLDMARHYRPVDYGQTNWRDIYYSTSSSGQDPNVITDYFISLHWSMSQLAGGMDEVQPQNLCERVYAVTAFAMGFILGCWYLSNFTSLLTQLRVVSNRNTRQLQALRKFLVDSDITQSLIERIMANSMHRIQVKEAMNRERDVELLQEIPESLRHRLHFEMYQPDFARHPLFKVLCENAPHTMAKVFHNAIETQFYGDCEVIFNVGDTPNEPAMYVIKKGSLIYTSMYGWQHTVESMEWVSEATLWTHWTHLGSLETRKVISIVELFTLNARMFQDIVAFAQEGGIDCRPYAQAFVQALRNTAGDLSDLSMGIEDDFTDGVHGTVQKKNVDKKLMLTRRNVVGEEAMTSSVSVKQTRSFTFDAPSFPATKAQALGKFLTANSKE